MESRLQQLVWVVALCLVTSFATGCGKYAGTGTMVGASGGAMVGGLLPQIVSKSPSKFWQIAAPLIGTAAGAAGGYFIDRHVGQKEEAEAAVAQQQQFQQVQAYQMQQQNQQQFQQMQYNTQLSVPVTVILPAQQNAVRNAFNGQQLAHALKDCQPGERIALLVPKNSEKAVVGDMAINGYQKIASDRFDRDPSFRQVTFQKSYAQAQQVNSVDAALDAIKRQQRR